MEHIQETTNYWILKPTGDGSYFIRVIKPNSDIIHWCIGRKTSLGMR